jgi:heme o synthase
MRALNRIRDFIDLAKPSIMLLVVLTGAAALFMEGSLLSHPVKFVAVIFGLLMTGACANALNQYFERDIDALMGRTRRRRPLPTHKVTPREALTFAVSNGVGAILLFGLFFNFLAALMSLVTILYYSFLYTLWLKPRTYLNIVIGGAAGAMAPVISWSAATGSLALTPWLLFLIVFFWTPPHFWALALCLKKDYAAVSIPMLPVIKGDAETRKQILLYTMWLVVISLALLMVKAGLLYLVFAIGLGGLFVWKAYRVWSKHDNSQVWGVFKYSIIYLMVLFVAIMADSLLRIKV